jgi:hypothetical protein
MATGIEVLFIAIGDYIIISAIVLYGSKYFGPQ